MNERIRSLMVNAIIESDSANDPDGDIHRMYIPNVFAEKFAQALAREYSNIVLHYADVDEGVAVANKHFGL